MEQSCGEDNMSWEYDELSCNPVEYSLPAHLDQMEMDSGAPEGHPRGGKPILSVRLKDEQSLIYCPEACLMVRISLDELCTASALKPLRRPPSPAARIQCQPPVATINSHRDSKDERKVVSDYRDLWRWIASDVRSLSDKDFEHYYSVLCRDGGKAPTELPELLSRCCSQAVLSGAPVAISISRSETLQWKHAKSYPTQTILRAVEIIPVLTKLCQYHRFLDFGPLRKAITDVTRPKRMKPHTKAVKMTIFMHRLNEACLDVALHFNQAFFHQVGNFEQWAEAQLQLAECMCAIAGLMDSPQVVAGSLLACVEFVTPRDCFLADHSSEPVLRWLVPGGIRALESLGRLSFEVVMPVWDGREPLHLLGRQNILREMAKSDVLRYHREHHRVLRKIEVLCAPDPPRETPVISDDDEELQEGNRWTDERLEEAWDSYRASGFNQQENIQQS